MRTEYFTDILISDKGMFKLYKADGQTMTIPASKVKELHYCREEKVPTGFDLLEGLIKRAVKIGQSEADVPTLGLELENRFLHVDIPFTDALLDRLNKAHTYSVKVSDDRYGVFR